MNEILHNIQKRPVQRGSSCYGQHVNTCSKNGATLNSERDLKLFHI